MIVYLFSDGTQSGARVWGKLGEYSRMGGCEKFLLPYVARSDAQKLPTPGRPSGLTSPPNGHMIASLRMS